MISDWSEEIIKQWRSFEFSPEHLRILRVEYFRYLKRRFQQRNYDGDLLRLFQAWKRFKKSVKRIFK